MHEVLKHEGANADKDTKHTKRDPAFLRSEISIQAQVVWVRKLFLMVKLKADGYAIVWGRGGGGGGAVGLEFFKGGEYECKILVSYPQTCIFQ